MAFSGDKDKLFGDFELGSSVDHAKSSKLRINTTPTTPKDDSAPPSPSVILSSTLAGSLSVPSSPAQFSHTEEDEKDVLSPIPEVKKPAEAKQYYTDNCLEPLVEAIKAFNTSKVVALLGVEDRWAWLQYNRNRLEARLKPAVFNAAANAAAREFTEWYEEKIYFDKILGVHQQQVIAKLGQEEKKVDEGEQDKELLELTKNYALAINQYEAGGMAAYHQAVMPVRAQLLVLATSYKIHKPQQLTELQRADFDDKFKKHIDAVEAKLLEDLKKELVEECKFLADRKSQQYDEAGLAIVYQKPWIALCRAKLFDWKTKFTQSYESNKNKNLAELKKLFAVPPLEKPKKLTDYQADVSKAYVAVFEQLTSADIEDMWNKTIPSDQRVGGDAEVKKNAISAKITFLKQKMGFDAFEELKDKDGWNLMQHAMVFYRGCSIADRKRLQPIIQSLLKQGFPPVIDDNQDVFEFANAEYRRQQTLIPADDAEESKQPAAMPIKAGDDLPDWFLLKSVYELWTTAFAPKTEKSRAVLAEYAGENQSLLEEQRPWYQQMWFDMYAGIKFAGPIIGRRKSNLAKMVRVMHKGASYHVPDPVVDKLCRFVLEAERGRFNNSRFCQRLTPILTSGDDDLEGSLVEFLTKIALSHVVVDDGLRSAVRTYEAQYRSEHRKRKWAEQGKEILAKKVVELEAEVKRKDAEIVSLKQTQAYLMRQLGLSEVMKGSTLTPSPQAAQAHAHGSPAVRTPIPSPSGLPRHPKSPHAARSLFSVSELNQQSPSHSAGHQPRLYHRPQQSPPGSARAFDQQPQSAPAHRKNRHSLDSVSVSSLPSSLVPNLFDSGLSPDSLRFVRTPPASPTAVQSPSFASPSSDSSGSVDVSLGSASKLGKV